MAQTNYPDIKAYQVNYGLAERASQSWISIRKFESNGKIYFLLVNPQTLETQVSEASLYQFKPMAFTELRKLYKKTPYIKALSKAESQSVVIQDAGIESGLPKEAGISLTADLCPSHKLLDRRIFTDMFTAFGQVERPVPIALSVTGVWMQQHQQDLNWLKQLEQKGEIQITWINHSFHHRVSKTLPLKQNFLLEVGTNINDEVLETEKAMLKNNLLPSIFFRFPGLVSDQELVLAITGFGLIPIGTDAWLAKGQQPHAGSIVLIHGNGNEPVGVNDFIELLKSKSKSIAQKQWLLYDLRETVDDEFEN